MARLFSDTETLRPAFGKIITIALLALFLSAVLLSAANDTYAFFKPQGEVLVLIDDPRTLRELAKLLEEHGVLANPYCFSLYVRSKGRCDAVQAFTGELILDRSMSYREILQAIAAQ